MALLKWSASDAVYVTEIDDQHREIFQAVAELQEVLSGGRPLKQLRKDAQRLLDCVAGHFAHEERLMRASRYTSMQWHKQQHETALRRIRQLVRRVGPEDAEAGTSLVDYLTSWLHNHARLPDRMLGAFLRNYRRTCKLTFQAGTKPLDGRTWRQANGERFDPRTKS